MLKLTYAFLTLFIVGLRAFAITGISAGVNTATGERPFRQEINAFAGSGAAWDLFILSLRQLQHTNQNDSLSYFQISGIHGYPQVPWDGVDGTQGRPGYCMHASVPFPTWHRPYVALYEQVLWSTAQTIATTYPANLRADYIAAAAALRVPYWDWAATPALPSVVTTTTTTINTPSGMQEMDNPLFNYTFQASAAGNGFPAGNPLSSFPSTVRHWNAALNQSNNTEASQDLLANAPTVLALTYQLLTTVSNYTDFSCTITPGGLSNSGNNIESIHNGIHDFVGGFGHMTYPEVAAFDPIFWLHHANVDRLLAMWQVLNLNAWVEPAENVFGTYVEVPGFIDSATSALDPFHSDNSSTLYTSDTVRTTQHFGYTYPEILDWRYSATDLAARVRTEVNALYNPNAGNSTTPAPAGTMASRNADVAQGYSHVTYDLAKLLGVNNLNTQWSINIQLQRFAYPIAFTIDFFIGDPPTDPKLWSSAPNLIGSHAQFIAANVSLMYPSGVPSGLLQGEISLTHTLAAGMSRGLLADLTPGSVLPLLAQSLEWRARATDGCEIDVGALAGLSVAVGSRLVQPAMAMSEFPVYGDTRYYVEATRGKCGGVGQGSRNEWD